MRSSRTVALLASRARHCLSGSADESPSRIPTLHHVVPMCVFLGEFMPIVPGLAVLHPNTEGGKYKRYKIQFYNTST